MSGLSGQLRTRVTVLAVLALGWPGCSRSPTSQPAQTDGPRPALSPLETVALLVQAREARQYDRMKPLIVPGRVTDVIDTLIAADALLNANDQLTDLVRREVGLGLAQTIDLSYLVSDLEIFNEYVELLDEAISDDTAAVSFLVDSRLPAQSARLLLVDGAWRYDPGPGDYQQLAKAFQRMAKGLRQVAQEIKSGRRSPQALRDDPELLREEVRIRLLPGVKMLPAPPRAGEAGGGG